MFTCIDAGKHIFMLSSKTMSVVVRNDIVNLLLHINGVAEVEMLDITFSFVYSVFDIISYHTTLKYF